MNDSQLPDGYESAIAVVGLAGRFAGARNVDEFWHNLRSGVEAVVPLSDDALRAAGVSDALLANTDYVKSGAPLAEMECFDAGFFGMSPHEAAIMDPQHRHFLEVAWEALEHAGCDPQRARGIVGVFAGSGHNAYMPYNLLTNAALMESTGLFLVRHTGNDKDFLTTRVSYLFDLKGPSINVQTACSTSLVAIHLAAQSLLSGECDVALAGGTTIELPHRQGYLYTEGEILSPDGHCRAFDASSQGTVFGSGVGAVVLKRAADAWRDGDTIHAILRGSAVNNDGGQKAGYLAPSVEGQAQAVAVALAVGDIPAETVTYVEAHGTGTPVGDPIEIAALTQAFRQTTDRVGFCRIGSVKTNIGHTDTAAGVASFIKVVEALKHREIPPSLHFQNANPGCEFDSSPFTVNSFLTSWASTGPLRAGVNSLGVGGTNAFVVLEEAPALAPTTPGRTAELIILSARSPVALEENARRLADFLSDHPEVSLADTAWTLQVGRQAMRHRRALVATSATDAADQLEAGDARVFTQLNADAERSVAFMFAGGGAQYPGMGAELYEAEPVYRDAVDECLSILRPLVDYDLKPLLYPAPGDKPKAARELERPSRTLPALFITQYAQARLWMSWGIRPAAMLGHSMGEYTAAHLAGVFSLHDAIRLVLLRGRLFEQVPEGGMLSVPLSEAALRPHMPAGLSIAAINAPELTVVSGPSGAIAQLQQRLTEREVDSVRVRISIAAHSSMLEPILEEFRRFLSGLGFQAPTIPFVSNLTGTWIAPSDAMSADYWVKHLRNTVRFADGIQTLCGTHSHVLLEVGPGRTLATLARLHPVVPKGHAVFNSLPHPDEDASDTVVMLNVLGRLWASGVAIDWESLHDGEYRRRIPLPTYGFERIRHWIEADPVRPVAGDAGSKRRNDIRDWFVQPSWRRTATPAAQPDLPGRTLLLRDKTGLTDALATRLAVDGVDVILVDDGEAPRRVAPNQFVLRADSAADWQAMLQCLVAEGRVPTSIVHAAAVGESGASLDLGVMPETQRLCFFSPLAVAQAVAALDLPDRVVLSVLSTGVHSIAGETVVEPVKATLLGPVRVIPRELPNVLARNVDLLLPPRGDWRRTRVLEHLVDELATAPAADTVAWRGDDRWLRSWEPLPIDAHEGKAVSLEEGAVCLVTGGLGGLGLALADHISTRHCVRLALISRRALPAREEWDAPQDDEVAARIACIRGIEARGSEVLLLTADVTDPASMECAVATTRSRFGPITALFHAAGILDDGLLQLKDVASASAVLAPKVLGTLVLDAVTRDEPLEHLMLFSSVSAEVAPAGQVDYAAANAFLNAYATTRRAQDGVNVVSLGWGPWREIGMAAALTLTHAGPARPTHPLLERELAAPDSKRMFTTRLAVERQWLLSNHRLRGGSSLIPGTGHIELARAAYCEGRQTGPVTLRDVTFRAPFTVADGDERDLCVLLSPNGKRTMFSILGRLVPDAPDWFEYATGVLESGPETSPPQTDLGVLLTRCRERHEVFDVPRQTSHLDFGPRWNVVRRIDYGEREAIVTMELPAEYGADLTHFSLHPALLDMATGSAQALVPGFDERTDFYVPASYGELLVRAPLTSSLRSHVRLGMESSTSGEFVTFDATIYDDRGHALVEVTDFVMMRVPDAKMAAPASPSGRAVHLDLLPARAQPPANERFAAALREGISTAEGMEAIDRILSQRGPAHLLVTPRDISALLAEAAAEQEAPSMRDSAAGRGAAVAAPARDLSGVAAQLVSLAAVKDAAACEHRDQSGQSRVVAYVVFAAGEQATQSELRRACRGNLDASLVPQVFVELDALPRGADGLVLMSELANPYGVAEAVVAPETPMEKVIGQLWQELLGVSEVGRFDNFFDVGGHSLLALRFLTRLEKRSGIRLLHEHVVASTLQQLAAKVEQMGGKAT